MALGVGATTAIFRVIDATLLHPLPYPNPQESVRVEDSLPGVGAAQAVGISIPELQNLQMSGIFQYVSIAGFGSVNLTGGAQPARIAFRPVTPAYFAVLGVDAQIGRTFDPHDSNPGFNLEVVISDGLWKRAFGADSNILGKTLRLDNDVYHAKDLAIFLKGQLDPAAISSQVREQVQSIDAELPVFRAETLDDVLTASLSVRRFSMEMVALFAATALLLAGLGIYGTISYVVNEQTREIAIRLALGAQRGKILKMVLRQSLLLAGAGAGLGIVGALIISHLMAGLLYGVAPTDPATFAGVTIVLTAVAMAASYIPALRAMRVDPLKALRFD